MTHTKPHIVIIGGGAGGLELATGLGNSLGKKQLATITLVDSNLTHIWKPLWHEVAAGTLTSNEDELNYIVQAYHHYFKFQLGSLVKVDRQQKKITLSEVRDDTQQIILPERILSYDILVLAIGSISYDFNVPGAKENCFFLDNFTDCQHFQQQFLKNLVQLQEHAQAKLAIAIIGGGATGVELAAELQFACEQALQYKRKDIATLPLEIAIIESSPRILPALTERISKITTEELTARGIQIFTNERVTKIDETHVYTQNNLTLSATLKIWAAGIKAPEVLKTLGLTTNNRNQIIVKQTLQSIDDSNIFAFGDCASCPQPHSDQAVPPRAQAAHQQAKLLVKSLARYIKGKALLPYVYHDYGALVSLSRSAVFGNLMARALGTVRLEGKLARLTYAYLYREHQAALFGWWRVILLSIAQFITRPIRPRLKLH